MEFVTVSAGRLRCDTHTVRVGYFKIDWRQFVTDSAGQILRISKLLFVVTKMLFIYLFRLFIYVVCKRWIPQTFCFVLLCFPLTIISLVLFYCVYHWQLSVLFCFTLFSTDNYQSCFVLLCLPLTIIRLVLFYSVFHWKLSDLFLF